MSLSAVEKPRHCSHKAPGGYVITLGAQINSARILAFASFYRARNKFTSAQLLQSIRDLTVFPLGKRLPSAAKFLPGSGQRLSLLTTVVSSSSFSCFRQDLVSSSYTAWSPLPLLYFSQLRDTKIQRIYSYFCLAQHGALLTEKPSQLLQL